MTPIHMAAPGRSPFKIKTYVIRGGADGIEPDGTATTWLHRIRAAWLPLVTSGWAHLVMAPKHGKYKIKCA
jgi:hypothetical protein